MKDSKSFYFNFKTYEIKKCKDIEGTNYWIPLHKNTINMDKTAIISNIENICNKSLFKYYFDLIDEMREQTTKFIKNPGSLYEFYNHETDISIIFDQGDNNEVTRMMLHKHYLKYI